MADKIVLVTGATGAQGGAVIDALQGSSFTVRALVRDPSSSAALALAARGVDLVQGDFDDAESLSSATRGAYGVFSVQTPPAEKDSELRTGRKLIEAAVSNKVEVFVHTSVARAGDQESFIGWDDGRWWKDYWTNKDGVNKLVRSAGFPHWVILKPAYMMDNFLPPKCQWMYPGLERRGAIEHQMAVDTHLDLIAAADVGRFAAAAFNDPLRFDRMEIDLASESLTMDEAAAVISAVTGKTVAARSVSAKESQELGNMPGLSESQVWASIEGYKVDLAASNGRGIKLENFADWARRHAERFVIGSS